MLENNSLLIMSPLEYLTNSASSLALAHLETGARNQMTALAFQRTNYIILRAI
jgi:hypothetical protein